MLGKSDWAQKCYHMGYGIVSLPEGRIRSRDGARITADNIIDTTYQYALDSLRERYPDISTDVLIPRAESIALSAIKFSFLLLNAESDMVFDPKTSTAFEGKTGPYVLYAGVRLQSILRKMNTTLSHITPPVWTQKKFLSITDRSLILALYQFSSAV